MWWDKPKVQRAWKMLITPADLACQLLLALGCGPSGRWETEDYTAMRKDKFEPFVRE